MTGQEAPITQWERKSVRVHRRKVRSACHRGRVVLLLLLLLPPLIPAACCG